MHSNFIDPSVATSNCYDSQSDGIGLDGTKKEAIAADEHAPRLTRLYFDSEKKCIGSDTELEQYERETGKSYGTTHKFRLPDAAEYSPIGKTPQDIRADRANEFRQKLKAVRQSAYHKG